jgi:hypothetical protein
VLLREDAREREPLGPRTAGRVRTPAMRLLASFLMSERISRNMRERKRTREGTATLVTLAIACRR